MFFSQLSGINWECTHLVEKSFTMGVNSTIISAKYRDIREIDSNDSLLPFYVTDFVLLP